MDRVVTVRGDIFVGILKREYAALLAQAKRRLQMHEREIELYQYTPKQLGYKEESIRLVRADVEEYTKALERMGGVENEDFLTVVQTESPKTTGGKLREILCHIGI
jgi:hypothetical protein